MNKRQILNLISFVLFSLFGAVEAAVIEIASTPTGRKIGALSGDITPGDTQMVGKFFLKYPSLLGLSLNSRGGDVVEAVRLGELVRALRMPVRVAADGICASACFFIWMNGSFRTAGFEGDTKGSGLVGLHRPFLINPSNNEDSLKGQSNVMVGIRNYLERNLISNRLIDTMMSRSSNDIYWLTRNDLEELGPTPPPLEELYIAKCKYNSRNITQLSEEIDKANLRKDSTTEAILTERLIHAFKCPSDLDIDAHKATILKLASGWLPPLPFKTKE